ncbi:MAG: methionine--tRNA ligase subunit beta [Candidatus Bathyarchaeia archaeon]|jgi:methionyl-tRNA synthetase
MEITFDDFVKLDLQIGKVLEAQQVVDSKKLIKLLVDFGSETRQCVAGLLTYYEPEYLVGKKFVFLLNLPKRKLMGLESECMVLAAEDTDGNVSLVVPEKDISVGSKLG